MMIFSSVVLMALVGVGVIAAIPVLVLLYRHRQERQLRLQILEEQLHKQRLQNELAEEARADAILKEEFEKHRSHPHE